MKKILHLILFSVLASTCLADDQTRRAQAALSEAGFYFGTADGKMGEETRAALRRFQIRNGLDVSGSLTPETLAALKIENTGESASTEAPSVAAEDEKQIADTTPATDDNPIHKNVDPEPATELVRSPVRDFFANTDLADSSAGEQAEALEIAQGQLLRLGYYRSNPDGLPGPETETALLRFQHATQLRLSGRLDADTRRALADAPPSVPSKSFRRSQNRPPGVVLRGIWVR